MIYFLIPLQPLKPAAKAGESASSSAASARTANKVTIHTNMGDITVELFADVVCYIVYLSSYLRIIVDIYPIDVPIVYFSLSFYSSPVSISCILTILLYKSINQ